MARTLTPEREQLKAHAATLRKQGWTEQAIAEELEIPRGTIRDWLINLYSGDNATMGNTAKSWHIGGNNTNTKPAKISLQFRTFLGPIEDFETDIRFPLIIADPPWNISVEGSMNFTFKDKKGNRHTPMIRNFGIWDFQGDDATYLQMIANWLEKLYQLASDNSWCWFWCSYRYLSHINNIGASIGWEDKGWYVWAKNNSPPLTASINGTLIPSLEPCLIFRKGSGKLRTNSHGHPNYKELPFVPISQRMRGTDNVAAKPAGILCDIIEWCTESGEWVLDAFAGTGSTTKAALNKKRNVCAVETDKKQLTLLELDIEEKYGLMGWQQW